MKQSQEKLEVLKAKQAKLNEQIRRIEERDQERKERTFLSLARRHGLIEFEPDQLEELMAKIAESFKTDTASPEKLRTPPTADSTGETAPSESAGTASENAPPMTDSARKKAGLFGFGN